MNAYNPGSARRRIAVLAVLSLLASLLVAAPAGAADPDPLPDYTATFDACGDTPQSGFEDVPEASPDVDDIDCIAYYGITKGTSVTTYSPLDLVTREQMALFLTRLARVTGISLPPATDSAFEDIGELSLNSQAAINQLEQLDVTRGTSTTTYSPGASVSRGHMALFVQRLMNIMAPMADGSAQSRSSERYGYLPSDVEENELVRAVMSGRRVAPEILSPFGDLKSSTKGEYDAITQLYELGVVHGISDTAYAPHAFMTRASMATFMAGVLRHSNAQPAGVTIHSSLATGWGDIQPTILVAMRDATFGPVEGQAVDVFSSAAEGEGIQRDGTCDLSTSGAIEGDCEWSENDVATDENGNIFLSESVEEGETRKFYAWIGEDTGDEYDSDGTEAATTVVVATQGVASLKVTSDVGENATDDKVDLGATNSVTFTAQLVSIDGEEVVRPDVTVEVGVARVGYSNAKESVLTTNHKGRTTYVVEGPEDTSNGAQVRVDTITFTTLLPSGETIGSPVVETINWVEEDSMVSGSKISSVVDYVVLRKDSATIRVAVQLYDQYGNPHRSYRNQTASITIGTGDDNQADRKVSSRGLATWSRSVDAEAGSPIDVSYAVEVHSRDIDGVLLSGDDERILDDEVGVTDPDDTTEEVSVYNSTNEDEDVIARKVQVVSEATSADTGSVTVNAVFGDRNLFLTGADDESDTLFSYENDDVFVDDEGETVTVSQFEAALGENLEEITTKPMVIVVVYSNDAASIFVVSTRAEGN